MTLSWRRPKKKKKFYKLKRYKYNDPRYKEWRKAVIKRDKGCCRFPGCKSKRRLQVHHIKMWEYYPASRFVISNGITLCKICHERVKGHEDSYMSMFMRIINESSS